MKEKEKTSREKLRERKPLVLDKIIAHEHEMIPRIQLQADYMCNMKCSHCSISNVKDKSRHQLTLDEIHNLFVEADKLGISRMTISGGEPLMFSNLDEMILAIDPSKFWIQIDTNGLLLSKEKLFHLRKMGVDSIAPSLDTLNFKEEASFGHGNKAAQNIIDHIDFIKECDFQIFMQTVVTRSRLYSNEFIEYLKYFTERKVGVFVSFAKPVGAFAGQYSECINHEDLKFFESLEKQYMTFTHLTPGYGLNEEKHCVAGKNIFAVTAYGDVLPCIYWYCSFGNILDESFETIYKRMQSTNIFDHPTCLLADNTNHFIEKYVDPLYKENKKLPVSYKEILTEKDFRK
jgi:MoaA/NifB/PqqE/SkfB family radical SAM enzyme